MCKDCAAQARSSDGRPLKFYNVSLSGGFTARYVDTDEPYNSHDCFILGIHCYADEHRFGGIVIQMV